MKDHSELKRLAETATPGPWVAQHPNAGQRGSEVASGNGLNQVCADLGPSNALYIAAANPTVVLTLVAEVEGLRKLPTAWSEVYEQSDELDALRDEKLAWLSERDQLKAEVEALRKDADRYRWLRDESIDPGNVIDKKVGTFNSEDGGYPIWEYQAGKELDDAIDTAMIEVNNK